MSFDDNAQLDTSQVEDVRGRRGGGLAIGGGLGAIIALIAAIFGVKVVGDSGSSAPSSSTASAESLAARCHTGADANQQADCRVVGVVNSVQRFWGDTFSASGLHYTNSPTVLYSGSIQTGCGAATSAVGPFYCPVDKKVYLDLGFFNQLQSQFGAEGGPLAEAYVIAHEYGHHVQDLLGTMDRVGSSRTGPQSASVRLELQADCYGGVWARHAVETGFYSRPFTQQELGQAIDAAAAVGDDRIQSEFQGRVTPETWTHGSSAQRTEWFTTGYSTGNPSACDTFSGSI